MKDKIIKIIENNFKSTESLTEFKNKSAEEIELLFEIEVLKGKIEVLESNFTEDKFYGLYDIKLIKRILLQQLKKLNNESN
jgi:hypothetical protein